MCGLSGKEGLNAAFDFPWQVCTPLGDVYAQG